MTVLKNFIIISFISSLLHNYALASSYSGLGETSLPKKVIQKYAPPPIDPNLQREIEKEKQINSGGGGFVLSPSGDRVFFNWRVTGANQVWRLDGPNTFPIQMTSGEDNTSVEGITYDGKWIFVGRDRKGEENPGLFMQSSDGGALVTVHHQPKVQTQMELLSRDKAHIYFSANDVKPEFRAIYRFNIRTQETTRIFSQDGIWGIASESEDAKKLLLQKNITNIISEYYLFDVATSALTYVVGKDEPTDVSLEVTMGYKADTYLITTNKFGEFSRGYLWEKGKFEPLTPEIPHDVQYIGMNRSKSRIFYSVNEDGFSKLYFLDAKTLKPIDLPKLPISGETHLEGETYDGRTSTFVVASETELPVRFTYDWKSKDTKKWNQGFAPEVDVTNYVKAELMKYPARDGTLIPIFVYKSNACKNKLCPVIVDFHGGPEAQSTPGFDPGIQRYLRAGYHFVLPNVRGSMGYGKSWLNSDNGPKRLNVITDIEDASVFLRKQFAVAGKAPKVGIMGGSYGGYSTLVGMSIFAGSFDAGVAIVGMSNLISFLKNTAPYRRVLRIPEYGDPDKDAAALKQLSPINFANKVKAPLMILQGLNDPRVPAGEAVQFAETLEKKKVPVQLVLFPNSGHGAASRADAVSFSAYAFAFFEKYLKN